MDTVFYGVKSKKRCVHNQRLEKRHWYDQMLFEDADSCLLRLIECFMEAAPQLVLQLFILTKHGSEEHTLLGEFCNFCLLIEWTCTITYTHFLALSELDSRLCASVLSFRTISPKPLASLLSYCIHTSLRGC